LAGAGEADALGGAGDEDDFVLEAVGHGEGNLKNLAQRTLRAQRVQRKTRSKEERADEKKITRGRTGR
jgi:hypothetical protein